MVNNNVLAKINCVKFLALARYLNSFREMKRIFLSLPLPFLSPSTFLIANGERSFYLLVFGPYKKSRKNCNMRKVTLIQRQNRLWLQNRKRYPGESIMIFIWILKLLGEQCGYRSPYILNKKLFTVFLKNVNDPEIEQLGINAIDENDKDSFRDIADIAKSIVYYRGKDDRKLKLRRSRRTRRAVKRLNL